MNQHIIFEDVNMSGIKDVIINEPSSSPLPHHHHLSIANSSFTPSFNNSSNNQTDSGYLSTTPHSITYNINNTTESRSKSSRTLSTNQKFCWLNKSNYYERRKLKLNTFNNNFDHDANNFMKPHLNSFEENQQQKLRQQYLSKLIVDSNTSTVCKDRNEFKTELREYRTRSRKSNSTETTNNVVQSLLSPPASPAASCSFIEDEIASKLVIVPPHNSSTPYVDSSKSLSHITCTPKTSKTSPASVISIKNRYNKLKYNHLAHDIKRKRLDFNLKQSYYQGIITPDYTGKETVDILSLLGEKTYHPRIIRKIFSYLKPQDLCAISMVSRSWKRICRLDTLANLRRLQFIEWKQNSKENVNNQKSTSLVKKTNCFSLSPKIKLVKRNYLMEVQNTQVSTRRMIPSSSPPVSPSKVKFHSYVKASRTLSPSQRLFRCPKCFFACRMNIENNVGTCTREGCGAEFCTICSSSRHDGAACNTPLLLTPTKRKEQPVVVGSKKSKRNLRRL
ncbi:F-box only protein 43-like [Chelonus insularis]|uniref:F-box only protein 43-like n=1 Tax=Chelonus insularis TaxID=460826 RepID=UPI00158B3D0D|nr:F-box only protein 43-like [Chelonus insularis]